MVKNVKLYVKTGAAAALCALLAIQAPCLASSLSEAGERRTGGSRVPAEDMSEASEEEKILELEEDLIEGQTEIDPAFEEDEDEFWENFFFEDSESYDNDDLITEAGTGQEVVNYASQYIGNPYVWGGTSLTDGCDCSGYTMLVYQHFGISLPHEAEMQSGYGMVVQPADLEPGDLVFFGTEEHISHVAIYAGNGMIVHAAGRALGICRTRMDYSRAVAFRRLL